jgi:thiopeptide-type bacteriocin biosynthesis protein
MALSHTGFFLIRSPLYPIHQYREVLQNNLQALAGSHPLFMYALHIGSPDLLKELERYIQEPDAFNQKKTEKLRKSLYKYWVRACSRSTPYGLFAGCTTGMIGTTTHLQLHPMSEARQHVRLDMDYYTKICHHIQQLPAVSSALRYYTNNSLYKAGEKYRYAEYSINNNRRRYMLTAVAHSVFLEKIFQEAVAGLTIAAMVQLIRTEDPSITAEEAHAFLEELIQSQLLIAEIEPKITGTDNLEALISRLSSMEDVSALRDSLQTLQQLFRQPDFERSRLQTIHEICETTFPLSIPKDLLQIDLFKTAAACSLSEHLVQDITRQINELMALSHGYTKDGGSEMKSFATRFREQYESREMPLNLVLDGETGIGYGAGIESTVHAPFVEDIATNAPAEGMTVSWSQMQQLCLRKYEAFLRDGHAVVQITPEDLKEMGDPETVSMARSCYLFGTLQAASAKEADNGAYTFALQSLGGPSAANLLGRFCSGDPLLAAKTKAALLEEEAAYPDAVLAEVVHFPEARAANVLIRPALRHYEIPYIGIAGVEASGQIPVSDLMVSVSQQEVILRSKRLNKRIIPRLSSAHNYSFNSLPVYKFLCDLQHQSGLSYFHWDWGVLASRPRLPRVVYKNIIVCRASWTLTAKDTEQAGTDEAIHLRFFEKYRQQQGIPDKVLLSEADNELLLDLTQPLAVAILLDHVKKASSVKLKECLLEEHSGVLRDDADGVYAHEILLPLQYMPVLESKVPVGKGGAAMKGAGDKSQPATKVVKVKGHTTDELQPVTETATRYAAEDSQPAIQAPAAKYKPPPITRSFPPGSEWLYVKIYCGYRVAEELLTSYFAENIPAWEEDHLFEQFFFLRFADPQPHIRLRFLNSGRPDNNHLLSHRIATAMQPYIAGGQVQKIQYDTYVREIERYGAATMAVSEALFYSDSLAVLQIISMLEGAEGEVYRWKLAMRGVDMTLDDFALTLSQKKHLLTALQEAFIREFGGSTLLHKPLNDKYRKHQSEIMSLMNAANDDDNDIAAAIEAYRIRSVAAVPLAAVIRERCGSEDRYQGIVASHVHLFLNRIFVGKQRKHEMVLYHFLEKYYLSQLAMVAITK